MTSGDNKHKCKDIIEDASVTCEQNTTQDNQTQSFCKGISTVGASNTSHTVRIRRKEGKKNTK
jgi:hypothetical protein